MVSGDDGPVATAYKVATRNTTTGMRHTMGSSSLPHPKSCAGISLYTHPDKWTDINSETDPSTPENPLRSLQTTVSK